MSDSNSPNFSSPRPVLKLKTAASSSSDRAVRTSRARPVTASARRDTDSPHESTSSALSSSLPPRRSAVVAPLQTSPDSSPGDRRQTSHPAASTRAGRPQGKLNQKPGAAWSDELKRRMQEDMDALLTR
jgi:hypothetical protein